MDTNPGFVVKIAERLAEQGAVMMQPGHPIRRYLVGSFRWVSPDRVAWFVAHGEDEEDVHLLVFDQVQIVDGHGVCFLRQSEVLGYLTAIDHAQLDDPDDYRIGWQLWLEVAPLKTALIERALQRIPSRDAAMTLGALVARAEP